jgi:hypothetical protein
MLQVSEENREFSFVLFFVCFPCALVLVIRVGNLMCIVLHDESLFFFFF